MNSANPVTARGRYTQLSSARAPFLRRAEECSKLTIPSVLPPEGHTGASNLHTPFQGMGARGVNNLAAKLLLALMPPNQAFFRLMLDDATLEELTGSPDMRAEVEKSLGQIERTVQTEIETTATRPSVFETTKQLIVTGNSLLYMLPEGGLKVYRLNQYVVKRDPSGNVIEIVVHEKVHPQALPEKTRKLAVANSPGSVETVDLYTWVVRKGDKYHVHQEVKDIFVPGTKGSWPIERPPFLALRWIKIDGEDYGRGHAEEYIGDLRSLEALTQAIVEGSAASARGLVLVNPNGTTDERIIAEAENWSVQSGNADDVSILRTDKHNDFKVAFETIGAIQQRLAQAFLLTSSVTRDAERVTAEEIRLMAGELEDALGGVYSILAQEFQLPFVKRLMFQLEMKGKLPSLPPDSVRPSIVTGMEALGRGHDLTRLLTFARILKEALSPEAIARNLKEEDFIKRVGTALSLSMDGLLKTAEEKAAESQQARQQELISSLGPEALRQGSQTEGAPPDGA